MQARQHAWESGSSWVCRGFVEWLVSEDPRARLLRENSLIYVVPIMDIDNVAIGAGGKEQKPHDHNRDWSNEPHWRSVTAAIKEIKSMDASGQFDLFVDLHNPGADKKYSFYYIIPHKKLSDAGRSSLDLFTRQSQKFIVRPLTFRGQNREAAFKYIKRWPYLSINWVSENCRPDVVAVELETPWNTPHSTTDGYRTVGRQLGLAIEGYLN